MLSWELRVQTVYANLPEPVDKTDEDKNLTVEMIDEITRFEVSGILQQIKLRGATLVW